MSTTSSSEGVNGIIPICRALGVKTASGERVYGCSMWTAGGCLIVLPSVDARRVGKSIRKFAANCQLKFLDRIIHSIDGDRFCSSAVISAATSWICVAWHG
jgi:hypothetical protein